MKMFSASLTVYTQTYVRACVLVSSDHSDNETVFADGDTLGAVTAQSIRWSHYQPRTWRTLLDEHYHEMSARILFCLFVSFGNE